MNKVKLPFNIKSCSTNGDRTRVSGLKGQYPVQLDDGANCRGFLLHRIYLQKLCVAMPLKTWIVELVGFEPTTQACKASVVPVTTKAPMIGTIGFYFKQNLSPSKLLLYSIPESN